MQFPPIAPAELGRPSRKAATAALQAHLEVLKGEPLRLSLSKELRKAQGLGGQERRFAALCVRELSRHQRVLDYFAKVAGQAPSNWVLREDQAIIRYVLWRRVFTGASWEQIAKEAKLPGPIRPRSVHDNVLEAVGRAELPLEAPLEPAVLHSFPRWMVEKLGSSAGEGELPALLAALNRDSPLMLRTRPAGRREEVIKALTAEEVEAEPLHVLPDAAVVRQPGGRIFETRPMKSGRLQIQDVGSQLIVAMCRPPQGWAGVEVADVCAGAGGKSLGLADFAAKVVSGDSSKRRLEEARERVRELSVKNVTFPIPLPLERVDVALVDAPCSGVGSLAREPDAKWRLTEKEVLGYQEKQLAILREVGPKLKRGALLVYATCSLFREENEDVVAKFLAEVPGFEVDGGAVVVGERWVTAEGYLKVWPHQSEGGGFFAARLLKKG